MAVADSIGFRQGDTVWVVNPQGVRLRERPDLNASTPGVAKFGTRLRVAEEPRVWRGPEQWLRVTTDDGRNFWIATGPADAPFVSVDRPAAAFEVIVRDEPPGSLPTGGLAVRSDQRLDAPVIDRVQVGERLMAFVPDYQADGSTWYGVETPRKQVGWVLDASSRWLQRVEPPATQSIVPWGKCYAGLGATGALSDGDYEAVRVSRVEAFRLTILPSTADGDLKNQLARLTSVRPDLFKLVTLAPPGSRKQQPFSPTQFKEWFYAGVRLCYAEGVRYFEMTSEPNFAGNGLGWNWQDGKEFSLWYLPALQLMRMDFPEAQFGFPGLAMDGWARFLDEAEEAARASDWIGVHCWWNRNTGLLDDGGGLLWKLYRQRFPDKLLMVTEFSNNDPEVSADNKGREYGQFYQLLRNAENVGAAFAYASSIPFGDSNNEAWSLNNRPTSLAIRVGYYLEQPGFLEAASILESPPGESFAPSEASFSPTEQFTPPPGSQTTQSIEPSEFSKLIEPGPPPDFSFSLEVTNWPSKVAPGESVEVNVILRNEGNQRWNDKQAAPAGNRLVELNYQVLGADPTPMEAVSIGLSAVVEPGTEFSERVWFVAPAVPGRYQVRWDLMLDKSRSLSDLTGNPPKPLSLQVLDLPRVRQALATQLPDDVREREALIETMGDLLLRPIGAELQGQIVNQGLIPAVFDPAGAEVMKAALYGLYEARQILPFIEPGLREALQARADETLVLRERLKRRFRKEVRAWVQTLLPPVQEPEPEEEPVGPKEPIEPETTEEAVLEERSDQTTTSRKDQVVHQIIITPPSQYYARPPAERRVTVYVTKDAVKLKYGGDEYASPNRLDYTALDKARLISPEQYGRTLFDGLFNSEVLPPFQGSTRDGFSRHVQGATDYIFELESAPDQPALNLLKWEYLVTPDGAPLAVSKHSPFLRRMGSRAPDALPTWPLKVLVVICNPSTLGLPVDAQGFPMDAQGRQANRNIAGLKALDVDRERTIVTDALDQVKQFGAVEYDVLIGAPGRRVTLAALRQALDDEHYHILHVIAHGATVLDEFHLVMEDDEGREDLIPVDKFDRQRFGGLRLAVLDTCQSASLMVKGALHGLAPHLIKIGVPAVVAMQDLVPIPTAQRFTQWFYHHLARSGRIDMAMAATRLQLHDVEARSWNWGIPVLIMSSDDGRLFDVSDGLVEQQQMPDTIDVKERRFAETQADDQALRSYLASQAAQLGASPALVGAYSRWSSLPPSLPLIDPQDRRALTGAIKRRVDIQAGELAEFVNPKNGGGLRLDAAAFDRIASALNAGKHIILIGPPGTGKTTLAQRICEYAADRQKCAAGHVLTTATADWTTFDTVGGYVPTQQQTLEFRPGAFLRAIREGQWLIIDEINRAEIDKAFGELFTLLSGQAVDLPYTVRGQPVRVRPPKSEDPEDWIPDDLKDSRDDYQYVVHPTWRIIGTMNVYDKSYLFAMSFAFMRRFAFIDCDLPGVVDDIDQAGQPIKRDLFADLIADWIKREQLDTLGLYEPLANLIKRDTDLMRRRALGPAIIRDMLLFVKDRQQQNHAASALSLLGEAILLYAVPQLDGLDRADILDIYKYLNGYLTTSPDNDAALIKVRGSVLERIELLYPHIRPDEWKKVRQ